MDRGGEMISEGSAGDCRDRRPGARNPRTTGFAVPSTGAGRQQKSHRFLGGFFDWWRCRDLNPGAPDLHEPRLPV